MEFALWEYHPGYGVDSRLVYIVSGHGNSKSMTLIGREYRIHKAF